MTSQPATPRDQKQSVREHFGPVANHYATAQVHRAGPDLEALVGLAGVTGHERVLDVGCGAGHTALQMAPHVARVDALDLTTPMLEQVARLAAERGLDNVHPRLGDAEAIPFPDEQFEVVTCRLCAHHFQRPGRAVSEMFRVLAPGGRLILIDIVAPDAPELDTFLNTFELLRDPSHVRDHSVAQWQTMLGAAGFLLDRALSFPMRIDFEAWLTRIGAPSEAATALRFLFGLANREVRAHFEIDASLDFTLTNAVLCARRPH